MQRISNEQENRLIGSVLRARALAYALDETLIASQGEDCVEYENALVLSEMLREEITKFDNFRKGTAVQKE